MWAYRPNGQPTKQRSREGFAERARNTGRMALAQSKAITELYGVFARLGLQALKLRESDVQMPFAAPRTLTNRPVKWDTRSVAVCTLPLDRVHAIGENAGGKVNDVVLTLVDAALRDYLADSAEDVHESLVALCPMSVREKGDDTATTQVATVLVRLGAPRATIRERLEQVIASSRAAKEEAHSISRDALMDFVLVFAGIAEVLTRSGLDQSVRPSCNVLVSNVPGPGNEALYMGGSRLLASYPISTLAPGVNLNATVLSHGNSLDFGLLGDKHAMPDIERVARRMEHHFAVLERDVLGAADAASCASRSYRSRG
jgi:WS/DGAT/MGAT family acyltransferase